MYWAFSLFFLLALSIKVKTTGPTPPPPPFDQAGGFTFIQGGTVWTPANAGILDVVLADSSIFALLTAQQSASLISTLTSVGIPVKQVDASGHHVTPGFIDIHVHAAGAGGEMGPWSRTPEGMLSSIIDAGTTTAIGLLGTDGVTRDLRTVLQKLNELDHDGLTTYMWTGAYRVPVPVLAGEVQADITLISKVLGVGELAISDHRSSWPSYQEVVRVVSDARVAGMLSGKPGVVHFHVGSANSKIDVLWDIVSNTSIPITQMFPTHMSSRGAALLAEGKKWIDAGGYCDFTADDDDENDTLTAILDFDKQGVNLTHLTLSSDAFGSLPVYNSDGQLIGYGVGQPYTCLQTIQKLVNTFQWPISKAIQFNTINPASYLGMTMKGRIGSGMDGDINVLDGTTLSPLYVFGKGQVLKTPTWVKKQMFEV